MNSYLYWLLRYVPDVLRGERVNVGVIVGNEDVYGDWAMRRVHSFARANRLGGHAESIASGLHRLEVAVDPTRPWELSGYGPDTSAPSVAWIERERRQQQNNLQIAAPQSVAGVSATAAADFLFNALVVETPHDIRSTARSAAIRELRHALHYRLPASSLQSNVHLTAGRQQARFDFAVGRSEVAQLTQVWSFDVRDAESLRQRFQSVSFATDWLREHGGTISNPDRQRNNRFDVPADIPIRALYVEPTRDQRHDVFEQALETWASLKIRAFAFGQEEELADEASQLLESGRSPY